MARPTAYVYDSDILVSCKLSISRIYSILSLLEELPQDNLSARNSIRDMTKIRDDAVADIQSMFPKKENTNA